MWGTKKVKMESIEEEEIQKPQDLKRGQPNTSYSGGNLTSSSSAEENFMLVLGGGNTAYDPVDKSLLWSYNIPILVQSEKKRIIEISEMNAVLQNYKDEIFPNRFSLTCDGVIGLGELKYDTLVTPPTWVTVPSNKLMTAFPEAVDSRYSANTDVLNVVYKGKGETSWEIGMLANIKLRLVDEDNVNIETPFNNPIHICLKIIHLGL